MATKAKPAQGPQRRNLGGHRQVSSGAGESGSVSVSRDGLTFSISGKNVRLRKQSPLNPVTFDSPAKSSIDDGKIRVRAEGDEDQAATLD